MKKATLFCFVLVSFFSKITFAKLNIAVEPYIGYSQMALTSEEGVFEKQMAGVLGGRGGFSQGKIQFLLDFHFGGPYQFEENNDYTHHMWGVGCDYKATKSHAYLGYYFTSVLEDVERNIRYIGGGFKFLFGVTFASTLSINLEYILLQFDKAELGSQISSNSSISTLDSSLVLFTISAPLNFK
jgi:hypothetical protein